MRPLAVLILVLGSVSALVFAISSIRGPVRGGGEAVTPGGVRGANASPDRTPAVLAQPEEVVSPAEALPTQVPSRREVENVEATGGLYTNYIHGTVVDDAGNLISQATVSLYIGSEISELGSFQVLLNDGELPRAKRRTETGEDGRFTFSSVAPSDDYQIVIDHPGFATTYYGPVVVSEDALIEETIVVSSGHQLRGFVRDESSGAPIEGAVLTLDDPIFALTAAQRKRKNPRRLITKSNAQGLYFFPNVTRGTRVLICEAKGFATQIHANLRFTGPPKEQEQDCNLQIGRIIAGRVVGPDMQGIPDAEIEAISHENGVVSRGDTVSKKNGEFVIEDIGDGVYTLRTEVQGWDVDPVPRVTAGDTDVTIQVFPQGAVAGRVVAGDGGTPIRDFTILVRAHHPTNVAYGHLVKKQTFKGSPDGSFEIPGISEGRFVLQANAEGFAYSFSDPFQVDPGITTPDVVVEMTQGGSLSGRVLDAYTKKPIAGVVIGTNENNWIDSDFTGMLAGLSPSALTKAEARTDSDGRFEIRRMTRADYQVTITHPEYTRVVKNDVPIHEGRDTDLGSIELYSGATISGTVRTADGSRASGIDVYLRAVDGDLNRHMQTRTDSQGRYRLTGCPAGSYKLSAARPTGPASGGSPFDVILDMKNSETQVDLIDGREYTQDLDMGGS